MPLTDTAIKNAKPTDKSYKMQDEKGMYLLVHPNGSKYFRFDYIFNSKRKTVALGVYPAIGLKQAREKRDAARKQIDDGIDPGIARKEIKAVKQFAAENENRIGAGLPILNSFTHVALAWLDSIDHTVRNITQHKKIRHFEAHVFPGIGDKPINEIKSPDIFCLVKPLFNRLETAHRVHSEIR